MSLRSRLNLGGKLEGIHLKSDDARKPPEDDGKICPALYMPESAPHLIDFDQGEPAETLKERVIGRVASTLSDGFEKLPDNGKAAVAIAVGAIVTFGIKNFITDKEALAQHREKQGGGPDGYRIMTEADIDGPVEEVEEAPVGDYL